MKDNTLKDNILELHEFLIIDSLSSIYVARKNTELNDWMQYSNFLIDKFAIHSSTFYHLTSGIIERKISGEVVKMKGHDLFTVNSVFRVLIETYVAFNHIFVEPETTDEKQFRFLLWKLDGLYEEKKYKVELIDVDEIIKIREENESEISKTILEIENNDFKDKIPNNYLVKIFNPEKRKSKWRFLFKDNKIKVLQIIGLIEHCCKSAAFINAYKYSSKHIHSNFPALEEFVKIRGKVITPKYTDPLTWLGVKLTCLLITDICKIDENAREKFEEINVEIKNLILELVSEVKSN